MADGDIESKLQDHKGIRAGGGAGTNNEGFQL